ncbi:uncharacterized protein LOC128956525 [Oppia nitens]|uniref:uncharacterized protein LOC128956525 n=1 Tax=Oppia nitens TaxID=1686743 RepID=UPI0023DA25A9|nr:uncharacterized protein LOC128956525 [Oppia nitens]
MLQFMVYFVIMDDKNDEPAGPLGIENWDECCRVWSQVPKLVASIGGNGSDGSNGDQISNSSSSIGSQVPAVEPYVSQIEPTFTDIYRSFTSQQWRRFVDNWLDYGSGNVEQNAYNGRWFSSVDQLLKNRRKTAGVIPTTITLDYAYKFELPERDWLDPRMQTLIQLATDQIILVNDLFSFEKELMANIGQLPVTTTTGTGSDDADRQVLPQMANTVAITAVQRNCPIVEAQTVIIDTIEQLESEIIKLVIDWETGGRQSLPLSTGARQFINGLLYMAGGNYMFSIGCDRYNKFK